MSFIFHTSNTFSALETPYNSPSQFIIHSPKSFDLSEEWEVGLADLMWKRKKVMKNKDKIPYSTAYICADFIENSVLGDKTLPFFRVIHLPQTPSPIKRTYANIHYLKLNKHFIQNLKFWLVTEKGELFDSEPGDLLHLTLHFRKAK